MMNRRKQTSLSNRLFKPRTKSLQKIKKPSTDQDFQQSQLSPIKIVPHSQNSIPLPNPIISPTIHPKNVVDVKFLKIDINYKQKQVEKQQSDDFFNYDYDLGVQYVESHHLDSGFLFDQKNINQTQGSLPIIQSQKQIFTSILDTNNTHDYQLEDQNFTDQQDQDIQIHSLIKAKIKPSKFNQSNNNYPLTSQVNKKTQHIKHQIPLSQLVEKQFGCEQKLLQKLRQTAQFRQQKLNYWNKSLQESIFQVSKVQCNKNNQNQQSKDGHNEYNKYQLNKKNINHDNLKSKNQQNQNNINIAKKKSKPKFEKVPQIKRQDAIGMPYHKNVSLICQKQQVIPNIGTTFTIKNISNHKPSSRRFMK